MGKLLIKDVVILPMDGVEREQPWFTGDIVVEGNIIKEVGEDLRYKYKGYEIIEGKGLLAMPGMINCHTHAAMTLLRSYADDLPLQEWLEEKIWPREAHLQSDDIYWGTMLSILEMIKSGTTAFADMYFFMERGAQAVTESGIRASLCKGMIGLGEAKGEQDLAVAEELVKEWNGKADGRITCLLGPHAPYTCPPDYLREVIKLSDKLGVGLHIHLAETLKEVSDIEEQYGMRPLELMESIGLFENRHVIAAHCVHLSDKEVDILVKNKVGVAHNPQSNMKLASGIAPIPKLLQAGAIVGLGTDGAASNNNLDLLEEVRYCALLHKVSAQDPTVTPAYQVLDMATRMGAQVMGLDKVGSLKPGYKADIVLLDLQKPHLTPLHDVAANVVYSAQSSDVKTVIIDGKVVMKNKQMLTMDEERVMYEAQRCADDLLKRE